MYAKNINNIILHILGIISLTLSRALNMILHFTINFDLEYLKLSKPAYTVTGVSWK